MPDYEDAERALEDIKEEEESILRIDQETGRQGRRRRKRPVTKCELCVDSPAIKGSYKRHLQLHHLPWYFFPSVACWEHKESYGQL